VDGRQMTLAEYLQSVGAEPWTGPGGAHSRPCTRGPGPRPRPVRPARYGGHFASCSSEPSTTFGVPQCSPWPIYEPTAPPSRHRSRPWQATAAAPKLPKNVWSKWQHLCGQH
jgi:hypothetical protein